MNETGLSTDVDVAIIGAGAAGLSAAQDLIAAGRSVVVLEAANRIGGRAWTDISTFGVPFDRGCHWLHSASVNPYKSAADALGVRYLRRGTRRSIGMHTGKAWADDAMARRAWDVIERAFAACDAAAVGLTEDCPAADVIDAPAPWNRLVWHWMGLISAAPPEDLSVLDLAAYSDTHENWPVVDGYGTLVARCASTVPVETNTPVERIDWSDRPLRLTTSRGTIRAHIAIVTASTNVLADPSVLPFEPALPSAVMEAVLACPTGHAEKVAFLLDPPLSEYEPSSYLDTLDLIDSSRPPINFTVNAVGTPLVIGQLGGYVARDLERAGPDAMIDFAKSALIEVFGSTIKKRIQATTVTRWGSDAFIQGAYSFGKPFCGTARHTLAQPISDRLILAGEATSPQAFSTAHGARQSGQRAANQTLVLLGKP